MAITQKARLQDTDDEMAMSTLLELVKRRRSICQVRGGEIDPQLIFDILETSDYRDLAYRFGGNLVARVFKGGESIRPQEID